MEKVSNPQIPTSAVLKYIVRDRDKYKEKLETLVPYTKSLEQKVKELENDLADLQQRFADNEVKKAELSQMKQVKNENEFMKAELKAFREDFRQTSWYDQMESERKRLRKSLDNMKKAVNALLKANKVEMSADDFEV